MIGTGFRADFRADFEPIFELLFSIELGPDVPIFKFPDPANHYLLTAAAADANGTHSANWTMSEVN